MSYSAPILQNDLAQLKKANEEELAQAFKFAKAGNFPEIQQLIKKYPDLLSQAPKSNAKTNLINEIISELFSNTAEHRKLIRLLGKLVKYHPDKIDLTFVDENQNTLLHRIFWAAITIKNANFSKALLDIGIVLINLLKKLSDFIPLMKRKDSQGNSFLQNIFSPPAKKEISVEQLKSVQVTVADCLNPYKNRNSRIDFTNQSFPERLAKLLNDPLSLEPLETPLTCPEGYTLSQKTWDNLKNGINPFSAKPFKRNELKPNRHISEIISRFKTHFGNKDALVNSLNNYFNKLGDSAPQNSDLLFDSIEDLLDEYNFQYLSKVKPSKCLGSEKIDDSEEAQVFRTSRINHFLKSMQSNILDLKNGRSSCFSVNTKDKAHKLATIFHWINKQSLDVDRQMLALALIRDVCRTKRNPWGYWPSHSEGEFNTFMVQNKDYFKIPPDYSYDPALLFLLDQPHNVLAKLDEYIMNLQNHKVLSP